MEVFEKFEKETRSFHQEMQKGREEAARLFLKIQDAIADLRRYVTVRFDETLGRMDTFAQRNEDHSNKVHFHGKRINDHETRITRLENR